MLAPFMASDQPLIVQGVDTLLLEVASPRFEAARSQLLAFAELIKAPEHVHTYRITALSIWNARSAGVTVDQIVATLREFSRYPVPDATLVEIRSHAARFGKLRLLAGDDGLTLESSDDEALEIVRRRREVSRWLGDRVDRRSFQVDAEKRGLLKLALVRAGFPPNDEAGYARGLPLSFALRGTTLGGQPFGLRGYQAEAARAFAAARHSAGGSGVIVLPCGAGKTVVGLACARSLQCTTLVLCTSVTAARQWIAEALDKTTLEAEQVGLYAGPDRALRPFHGGHLPDAHPPPSGRRPDDQSGSVRPRQLGADHLRRSAPAAGAGIPGYRSPAGAPAVGVDRDPGAGRWPRG